MTMLDPVEDAIAAIKAGKVVVVVDDEDRENEKPALPQNAQDSA